MPRFTGPADPGNCSARARVEIIAGGEPGTMDVLVHRAAYPPPGSRPVSWAEVAEILEAALAVARRASAAAAPQEG